MTCKFCSAEIPEEGAFCPSCGKQIDGKNVCHKCGKIFDGDYCIACGTKVSHKSQKNFYERFLDVEKILSPTIFLSVLFILFVCSLFIGVNVTIKGASNTSMTTFWFFGDVYSELSSTGKPYSVSILFAVFCTIAMALNIVVSFLSLITGAIKYGRGLAKGEKFSLGKNLGFSAATFFLATSLAGGMSLTYVLHGANSISGGSGYTSLSAGSYIGIIVLAISVVAVAILRQIRLKKKILNYYNLCSLIMLAVTFALLLGLTNTASTTFGSLVTNELTIKLGLYQFTEFISTLFNASASYPTITAYAVLSAISQIALMVVGGLILKEIITGFTSDKPTSRNILLLSFSALGFSVLYGIFGMLCISESTPLIIQLMQNGYGITVTKEAFPNTGFILTLIIGVLQCVASMFYYFLMRREV